jgi:hypothetical protein
MSLAPLSLTGSFSDVKCLHLSLESVQSLWMREQLIPALAGERALDLIDQSSAMKLRSQLKG